MRHRGAFQLYKVVTTLLCALDAFASIEAVVVAASMRSVALMPTNVAMTKWCAHSNVRYWLPLGQHFHHFKAEVFAILAYDRARAYGIGAGQDLAPFPDVPGGLLHAWWRWWVDGRVKVVAYSGSRGRRCCERQGTQWRLGFFTCRMKDESKYYLLTHVPLLQPLSICRLPTWRCTVAAPRTCGRLCPYRSR
jgi:hypothetical protein